MTLNEEYFQNGLDQVWSVLRKKNTQEVTDKAKRELLDLFLEPKAELEKPEQVEEVFEHITKLIESKETNARREDMKTKRKKVGEFIKDIKSQYDTWPEKDAKKFFWKLKETYSTEIQNKSQQQIDPKNTPDEKDTKIKSQQEQIDDLKKRLEQLENPNNQNIPEQQKIFDDLDNNKKLTLKDKNGIPFDIYKDWDKYWAVDMSGQLGEHPRVELSKDDIIKNFLSDKIDQVSKNKTSTEKTKQELLSTFTVDAHFMDKKNLILESERNRLRDLSEQKYRESKWIEKIRMFARDRRSQNNNLEKSITQKIQTNNFIEQDTTQARIDGNIGTYAQQTMMWIDHNNITKTAPFQNSKIDNIAHTYLMGWYDSDPIKNKEKAIINLNYTFKNEPSLQSIKMGDMTGTDIMAQLDSIPKWAYKIQNDINNINNKTNKIKINLIWLEKTSDSEELEGVRYDNFEKSGREKAAKALHRWSLGSMGAKVWTGIALSTVLAPLWVIAWVTALWASLARAKSRRDAIKEIAKTHEDAINLWLDEIENRITEIEKNINNASRRQKTIKHFGMWSLHTAMRQKKILDSFKSMWSSGILKPTQELIQSLQNNNTWAMGEVLARIDAGHLRKTQFISTSQWGRNQTAIERNNLMNELRKTAMKTPLSTQDNQGNTISIIVSPTSTPQEWKTYRKTLQEDSSYQSTMEMLYKWYDKVEKDIKSNKASIARNSAGNYVKTAAAMTAGGLLVWGIAGMDLGWADTQHEVVKTIQPHEHTWYQLGKFDDANALHNTSGLDQVQHGQSITIQWEAAVDGIKTHTPDSFLQHFQEHLNQTDKLISDSSLNDETKKVLQNAISDDKVKHIMEIAKNAWADDGNARLVVERWREGMENITEHLVKHNMNDVTIKDITFDENTVKDLFIQKSWTQINATNRGFEAIVNIVKDTKTWWTNTFSWDIPNWSRVPYTLPFSNTYAYTSTQDTASQVQDTWQSRKIDTTPSNNTPKPRDSIYA